MKIAISCESTCDLSPEILKEYDIHTIPYTVLLGETQGKDGEITPEQIFEYVDQTGILPKTAAVNEFEYEEYIGSLLKEYDAVIHLSLSGELSSSCSHLRELASKVKNVYVIDSRTLSTGIGLLAIYAKKLADSGLNCEEIVKKVEERIPYVQASFVLNTLDYLVKGGRCSALKAFGANLLKLKPRIVVKNGTMSHNKQYRGKNNVVIEQYCADTLKDFNNPDLSVAFLTNTTASPEMVEVAIEALQKRGFKKIYHTVAGSTITSHCGPKCLGILYINDGGKD